MPTLLDGSINSRDIALTWVWGQPYEKEWGLVRLINDYRLSLGLVELKILPCLILVAAWMCKDMRLRWQAGNGISHTDSLGRDPFQRMADGGYDANAFKGECIGAGYATARQMFEGWKASPGHDAIMRGPEYRYIGVGQYFDAQNFAFWALEVGSVYDGGFTDVPEVDNPQPLGTPMTTGPA